MTFKIAFILMVICCALAGCQQRPPRSEPLASGAPINTQFKWPAIEQNLTALRQTAGKFQILSMTIRPASLEALVTNEQGVNGYVINEGRVQSTTTIKSDEAKKSRVEEEKVNFVEILGTITQKQGDGEQLAYVEILPNGATGYFYSARKQSVIKTDLAGNFQK